jgi:HAD superfamily hydrolase (TIGR01509 family)
MSDTSLKIKAVFFDLGETLLVFGQVNTAALFRQSAKVSYEFLKNLGQPIGPFKNYCRKNLLNLRIRYWLSNIFKKDFDALELLKKVNRRLRLSEPQWQDLAWLWYEPLSRAAKVESDIINTLTALKNLGLDLGILSNTFIHSSSLEKQLQQLNILNFFTVRLYSYQFKFRKPDVRIFKTAAERIGQPPQNVIFVGDRISTDIKPALKAGMQAVLKITPTNHSKKVPKNAFRINRLSELPQLIRQVTCL